MLAFSKRLCYNTDAVKRTSCFAAIRGYSSAGRALEWHSRGQRFDPAYLHQTKQSSERMAVLFGKDRFGGEAAFEHKDNFCAAKASLCGGPLTSGQIRSVTEGRSPGVSRLSPPKEEHDGKTSSKIYAKEGRGRLFLPDVLNDGKKNAWLPKKSGVFGAVTRI